MTLEDLRVFVAVCQAASVSGAAQVLRKSQPGVSQHLARLEKELEIPLLERRARGVVPTPAGAALLHGAAQSLAELSAARARIDALRSGTAGTLSLVTGGTTLKHFMQRALQQFRVRFPQVLVRFHQGHSTTQCLEALRAQALDLGLVTMLPSVGHIEQKPILRMRQSLLLDAQHPWAGRVRVALADLDELELISVAPHGVSSSLLREDLSARGIVPHTTMTVEDWDLAYVLVRLGLGGAVTPAYHAHEFVRQGGVAAIPIAGLAPTELGWAARSFASLSPPALAFMQLLENDLARVSRPGVRVLC